MSKRLKDLEEYERLRRECALYFYKPYPKQIEFHNAGARFRERALIAGNQLGKTLCAAHEVAYHMTGAYPDWWGGKRFDGPNLWWVGSKTAELTRDGAQIKLLGTQGNWGVGAIPKHNLIGDPQMARGTPGAAEIFRVRHVSGGVSEGVFKAFADGREKWQAGTVDGIWEDEEPDADVDSEAVTRTNATKGIVILTLTPLKGMSSVVMKYLSPAPDDPPRFYVNMTIDDVDHYSEEDKKLIVAAYPAHEREARARGIPMLGSGRIYPIEESVLEVEAFDIPSTWPQLIAMDFGGYDHPTAAVKVAIDKKNDVVYVTHSYRRSAQPIAVHASSIRAFGKIPVAWPHDGYQHDKKSGEQTKEIYRKEGLKMLGEHAQFPDDRKNGVEDAITEALSRMQTGRLKVFKHLNDWFEEFRMYHRKDGKPVAEREDLMKATHYALMMLRYARADEEEAKKPQRYQNKPHRLTTWMAA